MNKYYVYRHLKKGTCIPFYIGLGGQKNHNRAHTPHGRSSFWKATADKYGYNVQILKDGLTLSEACELEELLIKTYGRRNLGTGPLVNLTDGGEGTSNIVVTEQTKSKWRESNKGKQDGDKNCMFGRTYDKHHRARIVIDLHTGKEYGCAKIVAELFNIPYSTLKAKLQNVKINDTNFIYEEDNNEDFLKTRAINLEPRIIDTNTGRTYSSIVDVASDTGISKSIIRFHLNDSTINSTGIYYTKELQNGTKRDPNNYVKYRLVNRSNGDIYESLNDAHLKTNIGRTILGRRLVLQTEDNFLDYLLEN